MFRQWTSREKKLGWVIVGLGFVVISLLFSIWFGSNPVQNSSDPGQLLYGHGSGDIQQGERAHRKGIEENGSFSTGSISAGSSSEQNDHQHDSSGQTETAGEEVELKEVYVDVKGAVQEQSVYQLQEGDRVLDAIEKAGGMKDDASTDTVNLAAPVSDGMVIYVPTAEEVEEGQIPVLFSADVSDPDISSASGTASGMESGETSSDATSSTESDKININTASSQELETLNGIGPSRAEAIIQHREEQGAFEQLEDVMDVSGIGPAIFEGIQEEIEV